MIIQTEPIGSIPRPKYLIDAMYAFTQEQIGESNLSKSMDEAPADTIKCFEETGSEIGDTILEPAEFISPQQLGTTDDCGFSPFAEDVQPQEIPHF